MDSGRKGTWGLCILGMGQSLVVCIIRGKEPRSMHIGGGKEPESMHTLGKGEEIWGVCICILRERKPGIVHIREWEGV